MNVKSIEKKEQSMVTLTIEVSAEEFETAINEVYKKQRATIQVDGFRKGRAPRSVIEGMYGATVFYEDAINESYPAYYEAAMAEAGLESVAYTDVEVLTMDKTGYSFAATTTIRPEVKLGEYKGLSVPMESAEVTEEEVDVEMRPFIHRATHSVAVEREAKLTDTAVINFEGFLEGVAFDGGKGENFDLELGSGSFVPGFEAQIVGMKAGEEKDIDITFPEAYHEELAGKAVVFHVAVLEVKEKVEPTLDDEFAKDVSEFETMEEFRASLKETVKTRKEESVKKNFETAAIAAVVANMEVEVPEPMIAYQAEQLLSNFARQVSAQGIPFEQYIQMMGATMEDMQKNAMESAGDIVRRELALTAVAEAEGIMMTEEAVEAAYAELSEKYGMPVEEIKPHVPAKDIIRDRQEVKAIALIVESAVATAPVAAEEAPAEEAPAKKPRAKRKPKATEEAATEEAAVEGEVAEKPKRKAAPRKKKVEEPAAEEAKTEE